MGKGLYRRRELRNRVIKRKKRLCRELYGHSIMVGDSDGSWYKHDGQYSKGKIHCSCGICKYSKKFNLPTLRDMREQEKFEFDLKDYYAALV